jgi:hypothetical protein
MLSFHLLIFPGLFAGYPHRRKHGPRRVPAEKTSMSRLDKIEDEPKGLHAAMGSLKRFRININLIS